MRHFKGNQDKFVIHTITFWLNFLWEHFVINAITKLCIYFRKKKQFNEIHSLPERAYNYVEEKWHWALRIFFHIIFNLEVYQTASLFFPVDLHTDQ